MRRQRQSPYFVGQWDDLKEAGFDLSVARSAINSIQSGLSLVGMRDHELIGFLAGWRACEVGELPDGRSVMMVYNVTETYFYLVSIGEHDNAYDTGKAVKKSLAGKPSRRVR